MKVTIEDLIPLFKEALNQKDLALNMDSSRNNIPGWDSIGHLNLIVETEEKLKVTFSKDEIENIKSVKGLIEILNTK
jgi:acyl carrier protein